jgi:hypothetical protein
MLVDTIRFFLSIFKIKKLNNRDTSEMCDWSSRGLTNSSLRFKYEEYSYKYLSRCKCRPILFARHVRSSSSRILIIYSANAATFLPLFARQGAAKRHFSWTCLLSEPTRLLQGELLKRWTLFSSFCMLRFFFFIYSYDYVSNVCTENTLGSWNFFPPSSSYNHTRNTFVGMLVNHFACTYTWCAVHTSQYSYLTSIWPHITPRNWSRTIWQSVLNETPSVTCKSISTAPVGKTFPEVLSLGSDQGF